MATPDSNYWLNRYLAGKHTQQAIPSPIFDRLRVAQGVAPIRPAKGIVRDVGDELDLTELTPKFEDVYLEDLAPRQVTAQDLFRQAQKLRADQAREAVASRAVEQEERGVRPVYPTMEQASVIDDTARNRLRAASIPAPSMSRIPVETRVVPNIGTAMVYPEGERVVTGRYGVGSAMSGRSFGRGGIPYRYF